MHETPIEHHSNNESKNSKNNNNVAKEDLKETETDGEAAAASNETEEKDAVQNAETTAAVVDDENRSSPIQSKNNENKNGTTVTETQPESNKDSQQSTEPASTETAATAAQDASSPAPPPPPIMKGTLSYELEPQRRHLIRGMWNYENSNFFPPQRFELIRNLSETDDPTQLPLDGEFHGSFSLAYFHTTSSGKTKERSKVIPESGVQIHFEKQQDDGSYLMQGKGTNKFGVFHIRGKATRSTLSGDPTLHVEFRKEYPPPPPGSEENVVVETPLAQLSALQEQPSQAALTGTNNNNKDDTNEQELPEPSQIYQSGVVCLQGKYRTETSAELGSTEVVHRIEGKWAAGLEFLSNDKLSNQFEYEHKSISNTTAFPVSGRYSGWFNLTNDDLTRTRISEKDVTLKFRNNKAGYYNVEGKGQNAFGRYNITGTLTNDNVLTIFRHFLPRKIKTKLGSVPPAAGSAAARRPSTTSIEPALVLKLADVQVPPEAENGTVEPITPPVNATYSAVSRGVLRVNEDGSHSCQGKWAITREHFTSGLTSNFTFRLEAHNASSVDGEPLFPLDSELYKGSFQLKKPSGGSRYQTVVDKQIVMKFRQNSQGAYNVYGKGVNDIGEFNLLGTMVMSGRTGGQVELYRMYPPDKLNAPPQLPKINTSVVKPAGVARSTSAASLTGPPSTASLQRRESSRLVKLPSKLEDDDPSALLSRTMQKCAQILRIVREKDIEMGGFFSEPVDPVALGIPTYHQVIKEPMDLRTIHRRMESGNLEDPDEFARLVRLVFENAMTFNIDPAHSVHQAARNLLILFNQKYRDVERIVDNIKRAEVDEKGKKRGKEDKKKKRVEELKSPKRRRLDEVQAMASANAASISAILAAAPSTSLPTVSRSEFSLLLKLVQQLSNQVIQTHTAVAELSPGDENELSVPVAVPSSTAGSSVLAPTPVAAPAVAPERKRPAKRKAETQSEPTVAVDDSTPLTLEEQEFLTETINELPPEHIEGVAQIIREAAPVGADEDEIDLEIDLLDTKTQKKLWRYVMKFVKKSKAKKKRTKTQRSDLSTAASSVSAAANKKSKPRQKPDTESFFAFGSKGDSDSDDSDGEGSDPIQPTQFGGKTLSQETSQEFKLSDGLGDLQDDNDEDLEAAAFNWNISKAESSEKEGKVDGDDEDDAWGAAREHAAVAKQREAERKAREEKIKAEAEAAEKQRLEEAAMRGEEIRAQRLEEEKREAKLREEKEKEAEEARNKAREEARAQIQSVEQTVDLDAQRDIMKQYEQSFLDKDMGGASPSSDFGF